MKNKYIRIAAIVLAALVVLNAAKNQAAKTVVAYNVRKMVQAPVTISGFSLGLIRQSVVIKGFSIYNPKGFSKGILVDIPYVKVRYHILSLLKKKLHLGFLAVDVKEVHVVKNKEGKVNIDQIQAATSAHAVQDSGKPEKPKQKMALQIDTAVLSIGKVVFEDYTSGEQPIVQVYEVNIKEKKYTNITSASQLALLILTEPMKQAALKGGALYGIAAASGIGLVPVAAGAALTGKDRAVSSFNVDFEKAYTASLEVLRGMGSVEQEDKGKGLIEGKVRSNSVSIQLERTSASTTEIEVKARRYLMPNAEIAGGVLYEITRRLKQ